MRFTVVGLSHHTAPLAIRERAALPPSRLLDALHGLRPKVAEAVILSTCNRTELYSVSSEVGPVESLFEMISSDDSSMLLPHLFVYQGEEVAYHLFRVAAGIDSLVFGEAEILRQTRDALEIALAAGTTGPITSRLFQRALAAGKLVRSHTDIGRFPASVASAAVALTRQVIGWDLAHCTILVIGAGEMGQGVARGLLENGIKRLMISNHRAERAGELTARYRATLVPWPIEPSSLAQADIVVSCTGAPGSVLGVNEVGKAMAIREGQPLYLIDLAVPRDIDPSVTRIPGVHLHNIDDMRLVVEESLGKRQQTLPQVERIIAKEARAFAIWLRERSVSATIQSLRERAEGISMAETQRALIKLSHLSARDRQVIEALASRLTNKLLHNPTVRLRRAAREGQEREYCAALDDLFDLGRRTEGENLGSLPNYG